MIYGGTIVGQIVDFALVCSVAFLLLLFKLSVEKLLDHGGLFRVDLVGCFYCFIK